MDPLDDLASLVNRAPSREVSAGFGGASNDLAAVAATTSRRTYIASLDVIAGADETLTITLGATVVAGPFPALAGIQYTFGPWSSVADAAALVIDGAGGEVVGGSVSWRTV